MDNLSQRGAAMIVAFVIDRCLGEPPSRVHPVAWIGRALAASGAPWPARSPRGQWLRGAIAWIVGGAAVVALAQLAGAAVRRLPAVSPWPLAVQALVTGILLKPLLAWRMLRDEVAAVEHALAGGLEAGRLRLSHLVSRDTRRLTAGQVRESALESLAENLSDSLVAPLFWFAFGGLPAAALYRFANTADAMWGYRERWEWAGKWAARADDVLSFLPARLTALLLAIAGQSSPMGLGAVARRTPSPNGGWPMGMLALALGVRLGKPGVYTLNERGVEPCRTHTALALVICTRAAWLSVAVGAVALLVVGRSL